MTFIPLFDRLHDLVALIIFHVQVALEHELDLFAFLSALDRRGTPLAVVLTRDVLVSCSETAVLDEALAALKLWWTRKMHAKINKLLQSILLFNAKNSSVG